MWRREHGDATGASAAWQARRATNAALVLGLFRRLAVSVAQTAIKKRRWSVRRYQQRFAHRDGGPERLQALVFAKSPPSWRLPP